ncbi:MAG: hypothetical protein WA814_11400 [Candidatus Baltobacteraceae bacterium]
MRRVSPAVALAAIAILTAGVARAAQPTPVPDAKPDLSSLSFLLGTWACHSVARGSPRPDTTTFTMDYDGHWMRSHDVAPPFDRYRTRPIVSDSWISFNPIVRVWVQTEVDNFGGYGTSTAPGWRGNTMTWTAVATPDGSTGTDVFTKVSETQTKDVFAGRDKNGRPLPATTTVCTKR